MKKKCSNLSLTLDYVYNLDDSSTLDLFTPFNDQLSKGPYSLVLCLYYGKSHCVSSITIEINGVNGVNGKELSIDSKTNDDYQNRKYNILLRSIIIIISNYLSKDIKYIKSIAINPSSAYILMQHFGGELFYDGDDSGNVQFLEFSEKKGMSLYNPDTEYKKLFELYEDEYSALTIKVELNPENIQKAYQKFDDLLVGEIQITC